MIEVLEYGFMQRSLIAGVIIAVLCSVIGNFLVMRRLSLLGDGLAHIAFGGLTIGLATKIYPIWMALFVSVVSVVVINEVRRRGKIYGESALGILFSAGLAVGVVMISLKKGFSVDVFSYLFGSILTVSWQDVWLIFGLGVLIVGVIAVLYKELLFIAFDEESAQASGIHVRVLDIVLLVCAAVTVVVSMQVVGVLLVSSLIFIPTVTALQFSKGFKQTLMYSVVVSILSVVIGLFLAYYLDLAAGGIVVLLAIAFFVAAFVWKQMK